MNDKTPTPDNEPFTPIDWDTRLRAAVEQTVTARTRRRNERAELQQRRNHGLQQRHAAKLARTQQDTDKTGQ